MLGAVVSLLQFQVVLTLVAQGAAKIKSVSALKLVQPATAALADMLVKIFGLPHKFVPQPTHVILVAILLAVVVHLERHPRGPA